MARDGHQHDQEDRQMALTPHKKDPNREEEMARKEKDPGSFGIMMIDGKPVTNAARRAEVHEQKRNEKAGK